VLRVVNETLILNHPCFVAKAKSVMAELRVLPLH